MYKNEYEVLPYTATIYGNASIYLLCVCLITYHSNHQ